MSVQAEHASLVQALAMSVLNSPQASSPGRSTYKQDAARKKQRTAGRRVSILLDDDLVEAPAPSFSMQAVRWSQPVQEEISEEPASERTAAGGDALSDVVSVFVPPRWSNEPSAFVGPHAALSNSASRSIFNALPVRVNYAATDDPLQPPAVSDRVALHSEVSVGRVQQDITLTEVTQRKRALRSQIQQELEEAELQWEMTAPRAGPRKAKAKQKKWVARCPRCAESFPQPPVNWDCPKCNTKTWQPDSTDRCEFCGSGVAMFSRHHCRMCGFVACSSCTDFTKVIPEWGPDKQRVCKACATVEADTPPLAYVKPPISISSPSAFAHGIPARGDLKRTLQMKAPRSTEDSIRQAAETAVHTWSTPDEKIFSFDMSNFSLTVAPRPLHGNVIERRMPFPQTRLNKLSKQKSFTPHDMLSHQLPPKAFAAPAEDPDDGCLVLRSITSAATMNDRIRSLFESKTPRKAITLIDLSGSVLPLSDSPFVTAGGESISEAFRIVMPILRSSRAELFCVRHLVADGCQLKDGDAAAIAKLIRGNAEGGGSELRSSTLTHVSLRDNNITDVGANLLKKCIKYNARVLKLDLAGNRLIADRSIVEAVNQRVENNRKGIPNLGFFKRMLS